MRFIEVCKICADVEANKYSNIYALDKLNKMDEDNFAEFIEDIFNNEIKSHDTLFGPSDLFHIKFFSTYFYDAEIYIKFNIPKVYYFGEKNNQFICNFSTYCQFYIPTRTSELDVLFKGYIDFKYNINNGNFIIVSDDLKLNNINIRVFDENKQCIKVSSIHEDVKPKIQGLAKLLISNIMTNDFGLQSYTVQSKF